MKRMDVKSSNTNMANHIEQSTQNLFNDSKVLTFKNVVGSMISDLAVIGVAREFDLVGEGCDMHQGDKVGIIFFRIRIIHHRQSHES